MRKNSIMRSAAALLAAAIGGVFVAQGSAAELTYDLRVALTGQPAGVTVVDAHNATVNAPGLAVKMELYAVITNTNNTQTDDGFQQGQGSFKSSAGGLLGNLRGDSSDTTTTQINLVAPFNDVATGSAASGLAADLDADTDTDVGNITNTGAGNANVWFKANTANITQFGTNSNTSANLEFLIGTNLFTVGAGATNGQSTLVDFIPRNRTSGGGAAATNVYQNNGTLRQLTSGNAAIAHLGSNITAVIPPSPEPSTFVLMGLGGLGLALIRRRRAA